MRENFAKASARQGHSCGAMLAHSNAVSHASAFETPASTVASDMEVAAWNCTPAPLACLSNPLTFISRPGNSFSVTNSGPPDVRMLPAPGASNGVIRIALAGLHAGILQAARLAAATARVESCDRLVTISDHQSSCLLDGSGNTAAAGGGDLRNWQ